MKIKPTPEVGEHLEVRFIRERDPDKGKVVFAVADVARVISLTVEEVIFVDLHNRTHRHPIGKGEEVKVVRRRNR